MTASYSYGEVLLKSEQSASKEGEYTVDILVTELVKEKQIQHEFKVLVIVTGVKIFEPDWVEVQEEEPVDQVVVDTSRERPKLQITKMS